MAKPKPRYREAVEEIKTILRKIEDEEIDLDDLSKEVERAAELIILCRKKICNAEVNINRVLENLEKISGDKETEPS